MKILKFLENGQEESADTVIVDITVVDGTHEGDKEDTESIEKSLKSFVNTSLFFH